MNQNSCFKSYRTQSLFGVIYDDIYRDTDWYRELYGAKMNKIDPKEFPFNVCSRDFKTRVEAENFAKKRSGEIGDDVIISQRVAIVKFPVPDLKVEELVVS